MKKVILIVMYWMVSFAVFAQCPSVNITFSTQQQIDNFAANYPNCTEIEGGVLFWSTAINNLNGFSHVERIEGELIFINTNLVSLQGLEGLTYVGGLRFGQSEYYYTYGPGRNDLLVDLSGLNNLEIVGGNMLIYGNNALASLNGLDNLNVISGDFKIYETPLTDLTGLNNLDSIGGYVEIGGYINFCDIFLPGYCDENLIEAGNPALTSLNGLDNLKHAKGFSLSYNTQLASCSVPSVCDYLLNGGWININSSSNAEGCNSRLQIETSCGWDCPLSNISLSSQQEVNDFAITFPNCTEIQASLRIVDSTNVNIEADITNLNGLSQITSIAENLMIGGSGNHNPLLNDLTGLANLTTIGGQLRISNNRSLADLTGLDQLSSVGSLRISSNPNLSVCNIPLVCNHLQNGGTSSIVYNASGCNSITEVSLACQFDCPQGNVSFTSQQEIDDFAINFPTCTEIQGNLTISGTSITNLEGLSQITAISGTLLITGNDWWGTPSSIVSLAGLENLTTIGGSLRLGLLNNLTDLTGLNGLTTVGGRLTIGYEQWSGSTSDPVIQAGNTSLSSLNGLDNLNSISGLEIAYNTNLSTCNEPFICNYLQNGGSATINNNATGCNDANEILQSCTASSQCPSDNIFFATQQDIDDFPVNYPNCTEIVGDVIINDSLTASINNLQGLQQITAIGGNLNVDFCAALNDLTGLENLTNIGGYLRVVHNPAISSFQGLNGLTATGGGFFVRGNPLLTNFNGMENLTDIGNSPMWIFDSQGLNDINGLSNISSSSISDLRIYDNPNLSVCNTSNVCDYLNNNSTYQINDNASNCNDSNEVIASCITDIESPLVDKISLYPTPASQHINIEIQTKAHNELNYLIYNTLGKIVQSGQIQKQVGALHYSIELSDLSTGIYYLNFMVGDRQVAKNFTVIQR